MARPKPCPSHSLLSSYLSGSIEHRLGKWIERHLEHCSVCQLQLERLTHPKSVGFSPHEEQMLQTGTPKALDTSDTSLDSQVHQVTDLGFVSIVHTVRELDRFEIPGYELLEVIGRGGMGLVYKAQNIQLERVVAIKILPGDQQNRSLRRHVREMLALGALDHPNIVRAIDARLGEEFSYIIMEFLEGCQLSHFVPGKPWKTLDDAHPQLPVALACDYIAQVASAVHEIHHSGLVHRDIKPSNIVVTHKGQVKLLDLGLARFDSDDINGSDTGPATVLGSMDYIAPEQGRDTLQADARSDIYELGCTLFALLAGHPPFMAVAPQSQVSKLLAHACDERPDVRNSRPDVPAQLATLVKKMMATTPEDRPQTAQEVAISLQRYRSNEPSNRAGRRMRLYLLALALLSALLALLWLSTRSGAAG